MPPFVPFLDSQLSTLFATRTHYSLALAVLPDNIKNSCFDRRIISLWKTSVLFTSGVLSWFSQNLTD